MSSVMTTISGGALAIAAASARAGGKGSRATRAVEHRPRGARGAARDAASEGDDADGDAEQPVSQTRKRSPKPLPSSFGEGKVTGKKTLPFQDPFETNKSIAGVGSAKDATSPFDMPAATLDAPAKPKAPAAAAAASPFGAPAPAKRKPSAARAFPGSVFNTVRNTRSASSLSPSERSASATASAASSCACVSAGVPRPDARGVPDSTHGGG